MIMITCNFLDNCYVRLYIYCADFLCGLVVRVAIVPEVPTSIVEVTSFSV
jgi:hypothetical protein